MAARTTTGDVQAILGSHYDSTISLQPFIDTAVILVDWLDTQDTDNELSVAALEMIERYIAAHIYEHADQIAQSKGVGRANATFQGQTAMYLEGTKYGQTAILLDVTGNLKNLGKGAVTIDIAWLGKPVSEQTDYEDRD